jgi:hypothetical protein
MSTKHTPAPWLIADSNFVYALHDHKGRQVNRFSAAIDHYPSQGGTAEEGLANARLIAAAPELLEALQMLMPQAPNAWAENDPYDVAMWGNAQAAIAKATGKEIA